MPSDSNGVYSLPGGYLAVTGETILASQHNPPLEDLSASMSLRLMRSGAAPMTGPLKAVDGTAGVPGYAFSGGATYGFYKTTNGIGVSVGGALAVEFGAAGIVSGIVTASIPDNAVTYAKIQELAASRLLGNPTGGATEVSEISLGAGVEFSGTTLKGVSVAPTIQRFTSGSGTYTTPAGVKWIRIRLVGGGGGGGEGGNTGVSSAGGTTTFSGGSLSATGGGGASNNTAGGVGGTPANGNVLNIAGGSGGGSNGATNGGGGNGGNSYFGGGGGGAAGGTQTGLAGAANTGGGGGGGSLTGSSAAGGGAGAYVEHIISAPVASYTYAVAAGGVGQSGGGAGGGDGGPGAAGIVIVEEYY